MMALSRFTPWFAVSALMPLGSSSTHSFHLDFENINVMLRLPYLFSFIHHLKFMHIFTLQIMLVYLQLRLSSVVSERYWKIKCNLCIIFKYRGDQ